jgi:lipoprotein-releasing system permease protein
VAVDDPMFALQVYYIKSVKGVSTDPSKMYTQRPIIPGGVFSIIQNLDESYVIVPLDFALELVQYGDKRTALEIKTDGRNLVDVEDRLQEELGPSFNVLNQEEQHPDLYRLLKMEKLFMFLAFSMLLGIGSINIFFSLMMLALDKKKDISVLAAMGASAGFIRKIFLLEGILIAIVGAIVGVVAGCLFCWAQMEFGFISMGMETSVVQGYPIKIKLTDILLTLAVTSIITILISFRPAHIAARSVSVQNL